jgi:hypothetical protein
LWLFPIDETGDGIVLRDEGGLTTVQDNTAADNAGCDTNEVQTMPPSPDKPTNTWEDNRFRTRCGFATE